MKKFDLFGHLDNLTVNKIPLDNTNEQQVKSYDMYMTNRFVSMPKIYTLLINEINRFDLPKEAHYEYLFSTLPKRKQYWKYLKKAKFEKNYVETIDRICKYYEVGKKEAEHYMTILPNDKIQKIFDLYETR